VYRDEERSAMSQIENIGRRRFLNWLLGTSAGTLLASVVYPVLRYVSPPNIPEAGTSQVDAGPVNDPEFMDRGFKIVRFGAEPVIVIRISETSFRAFSATCTHLDCIVEYRKGQDRIWCNCHNGQYDLQGRNVAGPPPRPLSVYKVDLLSRASGQPPTVMVSKA
jgi:Rieske Fe-S protein